MTKPAAGPAPRQAPGRARERAASAIANPRLGPVHEGDLEAGSERYRALLKVAERLSTSFDRADLYRAVVDGTRSLTGADMILLRTLRGEALDLVGWAGFDDAAAAALAPLTIHERWLRDALAAEALARPSRCRRGTPPDPGRTSRLVLRNVEVRPRCAADVRELRMRGRQTDRRASLLASVVRS